MPPLVLASLLPSDDPVIRMDGVTNAWDQVAFMRQWFGKDLSVNYWQEMTCVITVTAKPKSTE
jgi:hypothetical protein